MTSDSARISRRGLLAGGLAGAATILLPAAEAGPAARGLPRARPESLGIDPAGILGFIDQVNAKVGGLHSMMLLRHGKVAAEAWWAPYAPQYPHMLFSLSKSFCSTGVGLAAVEGKLSVDSPVISFFNEDLPAKVSDNLAAMTVRNLLTMSTGHDQDTTGRITSAPDGNWVRAFLSLPVEHAPGSKFVYNSGATYILSAIVRKVTGQDLLDFLRPRLFGPLGITGQTWETCPRGISIGGWGLSVKTEDIARFGQLYFQKGRWNGRGLIPESWVAEATSKQVSNGNPVTGGDWNQGYGYQFWRSRHGNYRGDGAFGQFCIVMPEHDAVLAITSGVSDMGAVMNSAWEHLLPALKASPTSISAGDSLTDRFRSLTVPTPAGIPAADAAKRYSGRRFQFQPNDQKIDQVQLLFDSSRARVAILGPGGVQRLECPGNKWKVGSYVAAQPPSAISARPTRRVASSGAWTSDDTYTMKVCFLETPFVQTTTFTFSEDRLTVRSKMNVGFGPTERPALTGKLVT